jgi:amino acid adenylation domain-containing protein
MQQGLLFHSLAAPGTGVYVEQVVVHLDGHVATDHFFNAWNRVVQRHEILRTAFCWTNGAAPFQVVDPNASVETSLQDWRSEPIAAQEKRLTEYLAADRRRGFDLSRPPLLRMMLVRRDDDRQTCIWTFHHILLDGRSIRLVLQEVLAFYAEACGGDPVPPPPAVSYREFVAFLETRDHAASADFWKEQLGSRDRAGTLLGRSPGHRPGTPVVGTLQRTVSRATTTKLQAIAASVGGSLNTCLLAAWAVLLRQYTAEEDVIFGAVRACRHGFPAASSLVGLLIHTLPIRVTLAGDMSVGDLLRAVSAQWRALREHEYTPMTMLQEISGVEPGVPLFESLVTFDNGTVAASLQDHGPLGLQVSGIQLLGQSHYPLRVAGVFADTLTLKIEYDRSLFTAADIRQKCGHLLEILQEFADRPDAVLKDVATLSLRESQRVLGDWNNIPRLVDGDLSAHQFLESQARATPEAIAVVERHADDSPPTAVSYAMLDKSANRLAHFLKARGVVHGDPIGICMPRSIDMIVGVLGILKAGGACLPLDPAFPAQRLGKMVADARPRFVLTCDQQAVSAALAAGAASASLAEVAFIDVRRESVAIAGYSAARLALDVTGESTAYIVFTSGSTGAPKGIVVPHRVLVNLTQWQVAQQSFHLAATTLQFASLGFDVSFQELFTTWASGGTLVLMPEGSQRNLGSLPHLLTAARIERLFLPTAALLSLAEILDREGMPVLQVREIIAAGEQLTITPALVRVCSRLRDCILVNQYGPSETHVVTAHELTGDPRRWPRLPPIGRPIANAQIYILNEWQQPVPPGVAGELYVGGKVLAHGYARRDELTRERFVPDPFVSAPGARMYRTGDQARFQPDGTIECLGRRDDQVKLRGYRIELAEIESVLRRCVGVAEAVVILREDRPGDKTLAAYLTQQTNVPVSLPQVRSILREHVPDAMVPATFTVLPSLPLTPTGKIDRRSLPRPVCEPGANASLLAAPRSAVERQLVEVWRNVLGIDNVGVTCNFFDLGGDSLKTLQLASRMSQAVGQRFSVTDIFESPTIESLVARLTKTMGSRSRSGRAAAGCVASVALSPASGRPAPETPLVEIGALEEIGTLDAAAIAYLSSDAFVGDAPRLPGTDPSHVKVLDTACGRVGIFYLPIFDRDVYSAHVDLAGKTLRALAAARRTGARVASLTGLIPSATGYGTTILAAAQGRAEIPMLTTGHATTAATVVMTVRRMLQECGRSLEHEHLGVLGLGSVGTSALLLLLRVLGTPARLSLCDLFDKCGAAAALVERTFPAQLRGRLQVTPSTRAVPPAFYDASLVLGATNVPDVLAVPSLRSGTMLVDDSAPHCFSADAAFERLASRGDILFSEGGVLQSPASMRVTRFAITRSLPDEDRKAVVDLARLVHADSENITGCVLSALLSATDPSVPVTTGLADQESCLLHYRKLDELGFQAAALHCARRPLPATAIEEFARVSQERSMEAA